MFGALDITEFTDAAAEVTVAVGLVGAAVVGVYVATKTFPFVMAWVGRAFKAGRGSAGG